MSASSSSPTVKEILAFDDLPIGSLATRRAIVRWSDGAEGEALRWYRDEVLSPVDHIGQPAAALRAELAAVEELTPGGSSMLC